MLLLAYMAAQGRRLRGTAGEWYPPKFEMGDGPCLCSPLYFGNTYIIRFQGSVIAFQQAQYVVSMTKSLKGGHHFGWKNRNVGLKEVIRKFGSKNFLMR